VASILTALNKIASSFGPFANEDETGLQSQVLKDIVYSLPLIRPVIDTLLGEIVLSKAKENDKVELWTDKTKYSDIADAKDVGFGVLIVCSFLTMMPRVFCILKRSWKANLNQASLSRLVPLLVHLTFLCLVRKLLKRPTLLYKTVSDIEFLIEIPNPATKDIPVTWTRISR
jgi:hypothetical protein